MEKSIVCECGNSEFWYFGKYARCTKCYTEYKEDSQGIFWLRRFNKLENNYTNNWEKVRANPAWYSEEEIIEIKKCATDPIYFIEKYCKFIQLDESKDFKLYKYQKALIYQYLKEEKTLVLHSRQTGESTLARLFFVWYSLFKIDKNIQIITENESSSFHIIAKIKETLELLPDFLKSKLVINQKNYIKLNNGSSIKAYSIKKQIINDSVIKNIDILYVSDMAYYKEKSLGNLEFLLNESKSIILASGANKPDDPFDRLYEDSKKENSPYKVFEINWWEVPNRDLKWKAEQIEMLGEEVFNKYHLNKFSDSDFEEAEREFQYRISPKNISKVNI
jgi:hypothetical protein